MFTTLLQSLALASTGFISIGSISIVLFLLLSEKSWKNAFGYVMGYITSYTVIGLTTVTIGFSSVSNEATNESSTTLSIVLIILGTLLILIGLYNAVKIQPAKENKKPSRLLSLVKSANPKKTFGLGFLVAIINFKNLALYLSAISVVHLSSEVLVVKWIIVILVTGLFCFSVGLPVFIAAVLPKRSSQILQRISNFLATHSRAISIYLPLFFGALLLIMALTQRI